MTLDVEHILPKKRFPRYCFSPFNLSISCKRCNMTVKGQDVSFLKDVDEAQENPKNVNNYKFIHPNLDHYELHLSRKVEINQTVRIVKYLVLNDSSKGAFTYQYFRLNEIEQDIIIDAQGETTLKISNFIPDDIAKEIEDLLGKNV